MNDTPMSKQMRRKVSYVLQNDIFLSEISAYDTIWVCKHHSGLWYTWIEKTQFHLVSIPCDTLWCYLFFILSMGLQTCTLMWHRSIRGLMPFQTPPMIRRESNTGPLV